MVDESSDEVNNQRETQAHMINFADQQSSVQFEEVHMPGARVATNGDEATQEEEKEKPKQIEVLS